MAKDATTRVIIVNDRREVCILWEQVINHETSMTCAGIAEDGKAAIELARSAQPDLILMDAMMPGMDGFETTRLIKEELPDTRIIIFSAYVGTRDPAYDAGADDYMLMPVTPEQLVSTIRSVMAEYDAPKLDENNAS